MDHQLAALEALEDILNPFDMRRPLADFLAAVMFDDDEEDDTDADADEEEEDVDEEDEDDDEEDDDDPKPKGKGKGVSPRQRQLQQEAARRRVENKKLKQDLADATKRLKAHEDKDKSKGEKAESDLKSEKERADKAEGELEKLRRRVAIRDLADDHKVKDVKYFTFLLSEEGIELDEDGEWPDDAERDIKKLVKKHSARLVGSANGDEEDDEEEETTPRVGPTGRNRRPGRNNRAQRKSDLTERFPALATRRG